MSPVILGLLATVAAVLLVVMLVSTCMTHRLRRQANAPAGSLVVELIWNVIPWLILVAAVMPAADVILRDAPAATMQAPAITSAN
jgi:heme/copper-type cytochrome/quinol oxidase subunit 2